MADKTREKILELQTIARSLEPGFEERNKLTAQTVQYAESFLDDLPEKPAFHKNHEKGKGLLEAPFESNGRPMDDILELLKKEVDTPGLNPASGRHLGYIPGGGLYPSALGDYLAAVANRYAGVFFSSPGAVRMENMCLRWICDLIGYGNQSGGNLTSGGSIANMTGLVVARDQSDIKAKDFHRAVIYTTRQVHHCVIKAIKFSGLSEAQLRTIEMDHRFRMKAEQLEQQIASDKENGLIPLVIFASAGTTDLGAVDPLERIGEIARRHEIWFHVDAAYGGCFLLTKEGKQKLQGIDRADSVTIDPHKGLFLPYGSGALLVKDVQKLYDSQHMTANYLQDTLSVQDEPSPADLSPELSKHFRGLRMWLPLQLFGIAPFRAALQEKLELCRYFYREVQKIDGIEVGPEPEFSVMFFRYVPEKGSANAVNEKLVEAIHDDGRVFLSSTSIEDTFYIRLAVLSFRTHLEDIELTLEILREKIETLEKR